MRYHYDAEHDNFFATDRKQLKVLNGRETGWVKRRLKSVESKQAIKEDDVVISGYFNFFDVDNVQEKLDPKSVNLKRFVKNPVVLFNHNIDWVLGEVLVDTIELRDDGVYGSVRLPKNQHLDICKHAVALAEDGSLRTFSVRFDKENWKPDPDDANIRIAYDWELQEVSLVSIPAQPDSTFVLAEATKNISGDDLMKVKKATLRMKGARVAEMITDKMQAAAQENEVTFDELVQQFSSEGMMEISQIQEILSGEMTPVPDAMLQLFSEKLGLSLEDLKKANADDIEAEAPEPGEEEKKADEPEEEEKKELSPEMMACVQAKIPLLLDEGKSEEEAVGQAMAMCSQEKGCELVSVSKLKGETLAQLLSIADNKKEATFPVPEKAEADTPEMATMKSQLSLMGAMNESVKALMEEVKGCKECMMECSGYLKMMVEANQEKTGEEPPEMQQEDETVKMLNAKLERLTSSLDRLKGMVD